MRRVAWLIAMAFVMAWWSPVRAQFLDEDKAQLASKLDDTWLSEVPVDTTVGTTGIGMCTQGGNLYARDRLIDKANLIKRVEITMQKDKHVALKFTETEALEAFLQSIPYLSLCKGSPEGAYAQTFFLITSVDGHTKLSELWDLLHKH